MSPRWTHSTATLLCAALLLALAALVIPAASLTAQDATPPPTEAPASTPANATQTPAAPGTPGTPTPTRTPTLSPTPTATLTSLQARLVLAQTYLQGKDYAKAAALFTDIAEQDRGNVEALTGLKAALDGQAAIRATAAAPAPTAVPTSLPPTPAPTLTDTLGAQLTQLGGTALAGLLLIVSVYLLASGVRWLLQTLRELWYTRALPLVRRPAIQPGFLIGEFINGLDTGGATAARLVPLAMTEKLLAWNQLVQAKEVPIEREPVVNLGTMGWLKVLWSWILPAPRGYRVTGALLQNYKGAYQLAVQRTELLRNRVDRSTTFEKFAPAPEAAFQWMAGEAAKWLMNPNEMEASQAIALGMRHLRGPEESAPLTPSEVFDQALATLLPVRQQANMGAIDFNDARLRLRNAEALLGQLPDGSALRRDLQTVIADLRRSVPAG